MNLKDTLQQVEAKIQELEAQIESAKAEIAKLKKIKKAIEA